MTLRTGRTALPAKTLRTVKRLNTHIVSPRANCQIQDIGAVSESASMMVDTRACPWHH